MCSFSHECDNFVRNQIFFMGGNKNKILQQNNTLVRRFNCAATECKVSLENEILYKYKCIYIFIVILYYHVQGLYSNANIYIFK